MALGYPTVRIPKFSSGRALLTSVLHRGGEGLTRTADGSEWWSALRSTPQMGWYMAIRVPQGWEGHWQGLGQSPGTGSSGKWSSILVWAGEELGLNSGEVHDLISSHRSSLVRVGRRDYQSCRFEHLRGRLASWPATSPFLKESMQMLSPAQTHSAASLFLRGVAGDLLTTGFGARK